MSPNVVRPPSVRRFTAACVIAVAVIAQASQSSARQTGWNIPCWNCHKGLDAPELMVELSNPNPAPGEVIDVVVVHRSASQFAGVLLDSKGDGSIQLVDDVATRFIPDTVTQATHTMPMPIVAGEARFPFQWTAPATPGVTRLEIFSVAANGNMMEADDHVGRTTVDVAYGCAATLYYQDADGDGFGDDETSQPSCEPIVGMTSLGGDCDDADPAKSPGAAELCNVVDDNCDGMIDEGFDAALYYPDGDGDGFGADTGMVQLGCGVIPGWAPNTTDCNDRNPAIFPTATEVANGVDDNCNGQVDEVAAGTPQPDPAPMVDPMVTPTAEPVAMPVAMPAATPPASGMSGGGGCTVATSTGGGSAPLFALLFGAALRARRRGSRQL